MTLLFRHVIHLYLFSQHPSRWRRWANTYPVLTFACRTRGSWPWPWLLLRRSAMSLSYPTDMCGGVCKAAKAFRSAFPAQSIKALPGSYGRKARPISICKLEISIPVKELFVQTGKWWRESAFDGREGLAHVHVPAWLGRCSWAYLNDMRHTPRNSAARWMS